MLLKGGGAAPVFTRSAAELQADAWLGKAAMSRREAQELNQRARSSDAALDKTTRLAILNKASDLLDRALSEAVEATKRLPSAMSIGLEVVIESEKFLSFQPYLSKSEQAQYVAGIRTRAAQGLARFPNGEKIYGARGLLEFMIGDFNGALQDVNRALSLNPANPDTIGLRVEVNAVLGNCDGARNDLRKVISEQRDDFLVNFFSKRCGTP